MSSPRSPHHQRKFQTTVDKASKKLSNRCKRENGTSVERCRGRCRVQWSEKHVKEGLVLVQESQLARVVKTGPISEHYEIDAKPFASGQWAKVYRCRSRSSGTLYAAKYSSRNRFNVDCSAELRHEIALLSLCSPSPRVVRLHDVYETPKEIILVMEYAPGGDLQTLIDGDLVPLEGDVVHFVKQLVEGLVYLHERNIAHLDIKPQNLVMMGSFPECDVKLCDFEISRVVLEGTEVREILGTPDYVAPEILHYEPITLAADLWSLGVTTYVLLTGFSPFGGETDKETFQNISQGEVDFPEELFEGVSAQAKDFVANLLVLDPSARMTAKQCLRHEWLHGAPTQASPHLRKYLSKSREVLLERVVSRENLRRAALLSQTTSHANLSETSQSSAFGSSNLSQSEMCLNLSLTSSRGSLTSSECYMSPADSQTSLTSSQNSLATSQSCLLNKEQTQGLLNQAQSRSQANLNHLTRRGLLSRMRSLNQIQSQVCLLNSGKNLLQEGHINPLFGSKSQEKLYGLKCLSKSQGVLDIYRSLESLKKSRRIKKNDLAIFKQLSIQFISTSPSVNGNESLENEDKKNIEQPRDNESLKIKNSKEAFDGCNLRNSNIEAEENFDSLQSVESDTLTEDSDGTPLDLTLLTVKQPSQRQHSDISSHSNNSANSDDKDDQSEFEHDETRYTVAQLVSAFNKHQEVASQTSLEAIMTEKRVKEVTFPTGPKALRLFIPDINITERGIVRRKTSYKPRKNWEELRKQNEKDEGVLKDFNHDSGQDEEEDDDDDEFTSQIEETLDDHRDTRIDEKYKQCVDIAKYGRLSQEDFNKENNSNITKSSILNPSMKNKCSYQEERLPNYINPEIISSSNEPISSNSSNRPKSQEDQDNSVNLRDILQKVDSSQIIQRENLEKLRRRTSITKIIINDNLPGDSDTNNNGSNRAKSEPPPVALSSPTPSSIQLDGITREEKKDIKRLQRKVSNTIDPWRSCTDKIDNKKASMTPEERRIRGKVCTGSYTRAMEKFNNKNLESRKSMNLLNTTQAEKTRRKSSTSMPSNAS